MNDDTISRQAAIDSLEEPCKVPETWTDEYAVGERAQYEKDVKALNSLPPAERREGQPSECEYWDDESNFCTLNRPSAERLGKWVFNIDDKGWSWDKPYMCDQCGEWVEKVFKFCPNCGAKMEAKENEND